MTGRAASRIIGLFLTGRRTRSAMKTITVLLFCLAGFAASHAQAGASQWYLGTHYPLVRSKLIAQGYRPLHLKHPASDLFCYDDDLCRRFPEVFSCTVG